MHRRADTAIAHENMNAVWIKKTAKKAIMNSLRHFDGSASMPSKDTVDASTAARIATMSASDARRASSPILEMQSNVTENACGIGCASMEFIACAK